ncbi:MAG: VOC family protein [Methylococcaceae bacterium]|nr:VOC family protein [Methylococcaceae bacterium]
MSNPFMKHGAFSWCELMTSDVEAAKSFYGSLFGWEYEYKEPLIPYHVVKAGSDGVGGIMALPPDMAGVPPHWGCCVTVDDVDVTAAKAEQLGAEICMPPTDIPGVGRFCILRDPQGASITAISYDMTHCA